MVNIRISRILIQIMIQKLFLGILLFFAIKSFSQNSKYSLELNFPIPVDNNFIGNNYSGIIDLGARVRFSNLNVINIGASLNGSVLTNNSTQSVRVTSYIIQPRIFVELAVKSISKLHPSIGLGYAIMTFNALGSSNGSNFLKVNNTQSGVNFNFGLSYDIAKRFFVQGQFNFIKLGVNNEVSDIKFNRNVNILKIGIGYQL